MEEEYELNDGENTFITTPQEEDDVALGFRSGDQVPASGQPLHIGVPQLPDSDPPVSASDPPLPESALLVPGRATPVSGDDPSVSHSDPPVSGSPSAPLRRPHPDDSTAEYQILHNDPSPSSFVQATEVRGDQGTGQPAQQQQQQRQDRPRGDHSGDSGVPESEDRGPVQESSRIPAQSAFLSVHDEEVERRQKEQLLKENQQLKDDLLCQICCICNRDRIFLPCGHVVCCGICAGKLGSMCPSCRGPIEETVQIKLSPFVATRGQQQQESGEAAV